MSEKTPRFKVYDEVWVMENNRPVKLLVFAVVESMDYRKTGTEVRYHLVESRVGAGWGNNSGQVYERPFATKEELIEALLAPAAPQEQGKREE